MVGLASLLLGFAISLLFIFFQGFQIEGSFNGTFCGSYESTTRLYEALGKLSYGSLGVGTMLFVLAFETIVKRTKYLLTITFIIVIILISIVPFDYDLTRDVFNYSLLPALVICVPLVLFLYTKWSHLEFKAVSSFLLFGFILFMISLILAHRVHKLLDWYPLILSPLLFILGCGIIILPITINPKKISRALTHWVTFAISTFPLLILIAIIDIVERLMGPYIIIFFVSFFYILILFLFIIKDIKSEINLRRQELLKANEEFKADYLAMFTKPEQVDSLAIISHELRTPLTSIIGFTKTILKRRVGEINEEQERQLNIILNRANYLHELITDFIDTVKIDVNKFTIQKEKFDLIEQLTNLEETFSVDAKKKGLDFSLDSPEKFEIYSDKKRINQILNNLIGNAIKFTDKG
ncbi:MAG: sensor histidine kinase, partial [Promethearchaeota archaeon]